MSTACKYIVFNIIIRLIKNLDTQNKIERKYVKSQTVTQINWV